jgi:hypothetical protein
MNLFSFREETRFMRPTQRVICKYCNGKKIRAETSKASEYISLSDVIVPLPKTDTPTSKTKSNCVKQLL